MRSIPNRVLAERALAFQISVQWFLSLFRHLIWVNSPRPARGSFVDQAPGKLHIPFDLIRQRWVGGGRGGWRCPPWSRRRWRLGPTDRTPKCGTQSPLATVSGAVFQHRSWTVHDERGPGRQCRTRRSGVRGHPSHPVGLVRGRDDGQRGRWSGGGARPSLRFDARHTGPTSVTRAVPLRVRGANPFAAHPYQCRRADPPR